MNLKELKEIFRLIEKTDFTEVEIQKDELFIKVNRLEKESMSKNMLRPLPIQVEESPRNTSEHKHAENFNAPQSDQVDGKFITSPFVGTYYAAPSPDTDDYVRVGSSVKKGDIVCIVEAMKLMNELESEFDGKIKEILVENGQPVEFGEKLFLVE